VKKTSSFRLAYNANSPAAAAAAAKAARQRESVATDDLYAIVDECRAEFNGDFDFKQKQKHHHQHQTPHKAPHQTTSLGSGGGDAGVSGFRGVGGGYNREYHSGEGYRDYEKGAGGQAKNSPDFSNWDRVKETEEDVNVGYLNDLSMVRNTDSFSYSMEEDEHLKDGPYDPVKKVGRRKSGGIEDMLPLPLQSHRTLVRSTSTEFPATNNSASVGYDGDSTDR
jgi:hypothetical protein